MNIGDKFHSNINGGIEVTVIDTHYCGAHDNYEETLLICVGNGLLLKFIEVTEHHFEEEVTGQPQYIDCICPIENLKDYE